VESRRGRLYLERKLGKCAVNLEAHRLLLIPLLGCEPWIHSRERLPKFLPVRVAVTVRVPPGLRSRNDRHNAVSHGGGDAGLCREVLPKTNLDLGDRRDIRTENDGADPGLLGERDVSHPGNSELGNTTFPRKKRVPSSEILRAPESKFRARKYTVHPEKSEFRARKCNVPQKAGSDLGSITCPKKSEFRARKYTVHPEKSEFRARKRNVPQKKASSELGNTTCRRKEVPELGNITCPKQSKFRARKLDPGWVRTHHFKALIKEFEDRLGAVESVHNSVLRGPGTLVLLEHEGECRSWIPSSSESHVLFQCLDAMAGPNRGVIGGVEVAGFDRYGDNFSVPSAFRNRIFPQQFRDALLWLCSCWGCFSFFLWCGIGVWIALGNLGAWSTASPGHGNEKEYREEEECGELLEPGAWQEGRWEGGQIQ
jgi:hypothetical protein